MWAYVEADFRRDYGIKLSDDLPNMTWREFQALLKGLSPWGAVASNYESEMKRVRLENERASGSPSANALTFWQKMASMGKPGE